MDACLGVLETDAYHWQRAGPTNFAVVAYALCARKSQLRFQEAAAMRARSEDSNFDAAWLLRPIKFDSRRLVRTNLISRRLATKSAPGGLIRTRSNISPIARHELVCVGNSTFNRLTVFLA